MRCKTADVCLDPGIVDNTYYSLFLGTIDLSHRLRVLKARVRDLFYLILLIHCIGIEDLLSDDTCRVPIKRDFSKETGAIACMTRPTFLFSFN